MRSKLFFSLSILLASWLVSTSALAQEGTEVQEPISHPDLIQGDDKMLITDGDSKANKVSQSREVNTAQNTSAANAKKQEQQKPSSNPTNDKTQEDPLSFNFLYFIIQKFKFSDIVDE